jgi:hypothetical protein
MYSHRSTARMKPVQSIPSPSPRSHSPEPSMHTYDVEVITEGRWWMIRIPELDGLTQARWPGEIEDMARSYIAVSTGQPIDNIAVRVIGSRWWKRAKRQV